MNRDGWTEIWGELDPTGRLENELGLLTGQYRMEPIGQHFSLTDPIYGESKPFTTERLLNLLSGQCWQVCITEITNGVYALLYKLDESEDAVAFKQALGRQRYQHPDLATIRKAAIKRLIAEITLIATKHSHVQSKQEWVRESAWCWSRLWLQRGRGGYNCYLNVEYRPKLFSLAGSVNATRVGAFAPRKRQIDGTDGLFYTDLQDISPLRDLMLGLVRDRVMLYFDRCHSALGLRARTHKPFGMMPA
jgi:hypothetical protein